MGCNATMKPARVPVADHMRDNYPVLSRISLDLVFLEKGLVFAAAPVQGCTYSNKAYMSPIPHT
jgi:hypothetical protein